MKKNILISAVIFACCLLHTACCFSQGTAINSTGAKADSSALLDLSDTTKGILIPRMKKTNKLAISNPANGLLVYQTDDTTGFWYFNSVKWVQAIGPAGSGGSATHYPGELYGGGVVFWVDETGNHGLICSMIDVNTAIIWTTAPYQSTTVPAPGALSDWDGLTNTGAIVSQAGAGSTYAAGLCDAYTNADYGTGQYSDWYLPSIVQLQKLHYARFEVNKALDSDGNGATTAITGSTYWSSSENTNTNAFSFTGGSTSTKSKNTTYSVRAVRAF